MAPKRKVCPHCDEEVIVKVYKQHRRLYFNESAGVWTTVDDIEREEDKRLAGDDSLNVWRNIDNEVDSSFFVECTQLHREENYMDKTVETQDIDHFVENLEEEDRVYFTDPHAEEERDVTNDHFNFEIWDTVNERELNEDFSEAFDSSNLFVSVQEEESTDPRLLTLANWFCLFLSYLWYFHNLTDACMLLVIGFFRTLFLILGKVFPCIAAFSVLLPSSLYKLKKLMGLHEDRFVKYVVCPKCSAVYKFHDCYKKVGGQNIPVKCKFVEFPAHRQKRHRQPCGAPLLKEVELQGGKKRLYPFKVYCYRSVLQSLSSLVKRDGFVQKCELWRDRKQSPGVLSDIYDGRIWKEFQNINGKSFLSSPKNYAMQLNLDWFCPFKHLPYSVGALYLIILNLPRTERYKKENVILVGLLPGPREPSLNVNSFLNPLVEEMQLLWDEGLLCSVIESGKSLVSRFHAAIISVVSDVPATRKLCGFVGHMAKRGCSKCEKEFISGKFGEKINYGGFEPAHGRHNAQHRKQAEQTDQQMSKADKDSLVSKYGVRYTS
ncbi:uncharacterized protein [Ptychodera flava]|uniref:uncharacterized protein n=1 Tax=Ptychodera flava TaxID=63121 RepID=UPI00396A81AD